MGKRVRILHLFSVMNRLQSKLHFPHVLQDAKPQARRALLVSAEDELINAKVECALNTLNWNHKLIKEEQSKLKKLAASSMLHEAKVAYYAFDVAARFLILLFMPLLWFRWYGGLWAGFAGLPCCCLCCFCFGCACVISCAIGTVRDLGGWSLWSSITF